jgi:quinol monooxygenase YgiN
MPKLAIVATIEVAPERKDQLLPLLMAHRARCLKDEPGTLQFEVLAPREDDTKVLLYEVYRDDAAFDVHFNGPSIARARRDCRNGIEALRNKVLTRRVTVCHRNYCTLGTNARGTDREDRAAAA